MMLLNIDLRNRTSDGTTREVWYVLGTIHDFQRRTLRGLSSISWDVFIAHHLQVSVIFGWAGLILSQIAWQGSYDQFVLDPQNTVPTAHIVRDAHLGLGVIESNKASQLAVR